MSLVGKRVGQYRIAAELGRGQHAVVYKAWQTSLERWVALKVLHDADPKTLQKFQAEARLTAYLIQQGVPNIRRVYEVGQTAAGLLFVALEYVDDSLRNVLRRAQERKGVIGPVTAAKLLWPLATALDAIHRLGWVHLDLKPQNILLSQRGGVMLADFGIAERRGEQTHACTPAYASPEQAAGNRPVGPWSDIYSLGAILYEMVTGAPPVRGDHDIVLLNQHLEVKPPPPRNANPRLSSKQEQAILRALDKAPQRRQRTATELIEALVPQDTVLLGGMKTPRMAVDTTPSWIQRIPRLALVGGVVVLILALLALLSWVLWPEGSSGTPATPNAEHAAGTAAATPSATTTRRPATTETPATIQNPTSTLAPTSTRTPTPTPARTPTSPSLLKRYETMTLLGGIDPRRHI
ncbi:serine/threonine-protein kinase [Chloroflexota bacterium]